MERVCKFLKDAGTYYLATVENDQPRVRPFGTAHIFEGRLYIQTGTLSEVMLIRNDSDLEEFLEIYDISLADVAEEY